MMYHTLFFTCKTTPKVSKIMRKIIPEMLTLIAYRFAVGTSVPKISELTRLDAFILFATFLVFATLIEVIITSGYAKSGQIIKARIIDRWARWVFPIVFLLITLESLVLRIFI